MSLEQPHSQLCLSEELIHQEVVEGAEAEEAACTQSQEGV